MNQQYIQDQITAKLDENPQLVLIESNSQDMLSYVNLHKIELNETNEKLKKLKKRLKELKKKLDD